MALLNGKSIHIDALDVIEALRHRETYRQAWHVHAAIETHYVLSGALSYEFGGRHPPVTIPGGAFLVIPPEVRHRAVNGEGTPSVRLVVRWTKPRQTSGPCPFTAREFRAFLEDTVHEPLEVRRAPARLTRALREAFRVIENEEPVPFLRLAVWTLLAETAAAVREAPPVTSLSRNAIDTICTHIRAHCGEALHMESLVKMSGYSERQLFTLFRQRTGLTPGSYLTRCRIDRAKQMMSAAPRPRLLDVALACGFSSASHFASVFRTYVGETPRAYACALQRAVCAQKARKPATPAASGRRTVDSDAAKNVWSSQSAKGSVPPAHTKAR